MTPRTGLIATAAALCLALPASAQDADTVVATVDGTEITLGHMIAARSQLPQQYQQLGDEVLFDGVLEQLIQQTALMQEMEEISRADRIRLENNRRSYLAGVALAGVAEGAASEEAIRELYDAQYGDAEPGTEYNAAHILVETEDRAVELKQQLDEGADFATLARENSTDGSAESGGSLGWFGTGMMVPAFEAAVVALEPGQVSEPVETQFGWHLVRLNETREAEVPALQEVRQQLAGTLRQRAVEERLDALVAEAEISRSVEGIDPNLLSDQTLLDE